jgi:hypothetical protein
MVDLESDFARLVQAEATTLMGYSDVLADFASQSDRIHVRRYGGGRIVEPFRPGQPAELHLFPHGGTQLTSDFVRGLDGSTAEAIVQLVLQNYDAGTPGIANEIVRHIVERALNHRYVAVFDVSRLFLDANRLISTDQVPAHPYIGSPELYQPYLQSRSEDLRAEVLVPWIEAVNALVLERNIRVIYHHHSYDTVSHGRREHDLRPYAPRPRGQVFWKKPSFGSHQGRVVGLIPLELAQAVADAMRQGLRGDRAADQESVLIDEPLVAPAMPFTDCIDDGTSPTDSRWHVVYEVRKDILHGSVLHWVDTLELIQAAVKNSPPEVPDSKVGPGHRSS